MKIAFEKAGLNKKSAAPKATKTPKASPKKAPAKKGQASKSVAKKATAANRDAKVKKLSALDAAAKVLSESKEPMTSKEMIDAMAAKGYWSSPGGKTPSATLCSSIIREIATKGRDARFKKTERGKFAAR